MKYFIDLPKGEPPSGAELIRNQPDVSNCQARQEVE